MAETDDNDSSSGGSTPVSYVKPQQYTAINRVNTTTAKGTTSKELSQRPPSPQSLDSTIMGEPIVADSSSASGTPVSFIMVPQCMDINIA